MKLKTRTILLGLFAAVFLPIQASFGITAFFNEVRANDAGTDDIEFIEIIAHAGTDLTGAYIMHHDGNAGVGEIWRFNFTSFTVPDDGILDINNAAVGFVVISQDNIVTNSDFDIPGNLSAGDLQQGPDGLILYDADDNILDAVAWGGPGDLTTVDPGTVTTSGDSSAPNFLHVTTSDVGDDRSLQAPNNVLSGSGGSWTLGDATPGALNQNQASSVINIGAPPFVPTSQYGSMSLVGHFNGFDASGNFMTLVTNDLWAIVVTNINQPVNGFRFVANTNAAAGEWGDNNQNDFYLPIAQIGEAFPASDNVIVDEDLSGVIRFTFHDISKVYRITRLAPAALAVSGNFNGFSTVSNMTLIGESLWSYQRTFTNFSGLEFRFALDAPSTVWWGDSNQNDFKIPIYSQADSLPGFTNFFVPENLNGTYTFTFDHRTLECTLIKSFTPATTNVWINEIDYNQAGGPDSNEWVEICGNAGVSMNDYFLVLINQNGFPYNFIDLAPANFILANDADGFGFFVVGKVTPGFGDDADFTPSNWDVNEIENGFEDSVQILSKSFVSIHLLDYEGDNFFTAENDLTHLADTTATKKSLYLTGGPGINFTDFFWANELNSVSPGAINPGQIMLASAAPNVLTTNLITSPVAPETNDPVYIEVDITPINGAHNINATMHYRIGGMGAFTSVGMTNNGTHYAATNAIPPQPKGTRIEYYAATCYSFPGPGSNNVVYAPASAPAIPAFYAIGRVPLNDVWINEIQSIDPEDFSDPDISEFIEIVGRTGSDLSGWMLEILEPNSNVLGSYTFTNTILLNDTNGFGFLIVGDTNVVDLDIQFHHVPVGPSDHLPFIGAARLLNEVGAEISRLAWGPGNMMTGFEYIGFEDDFFFENQLALIGTGTNYADYMWSSNSFPLTPGEENISQTLLGGVTNPLPPIILCNPDLSLNCVYDIPAPDSNGIFSVGFCPGDASTTITLLSSLTNGSGCVDDLMTVTRNWQAVDVCAATSICTRTITVLDEEPPIFLQCSRGLINPSFESGDFTGWTLVGSIPSEPKVDLIEPSEGFFHAIFNSYQYDDVFYTLSDSHTNKYNGIYDNQALLNQPGADPGTRYSIKLDAGSQQRTITPIEENPAMLALTNTAAPISFAIWIRPDSVSGNKRIYSVGGSTCRRLYLIGDELRWKASKFLNASTTSANILAGQWTHVACTVNGNNDVTFYKNGVSLGTIAGSSSPGSTNCAGLDVEFFDGNLDDFQLYNTFMTAPQILELYQNPGVPSTMVPPNNMVLHYRLDDPSSDIGLQAFFFQDLPATEGEFWNAGIDMQNALASPLQPNGEAYFKLQFLNGLSNVITESESSHITSTTTPGVYLSEILSGTAPAGTVFVRLAAYIENDGAGQVYFDNAILSPLNLIADPVTCQIAAPDYTGLFAVTNGCGNTVITQNPPLGTTLYAGIQLIDVIATDACGLSSTCSISVTVTTDEMIPPVTTCPVDVVVECSADIPLPDISSLTVTDNCLDFVVTHIGDMGNGGKGCVGNPLIIERVYRASDNNGNESECTQTITVVKTTLPIISPPVTNLFIPLNTNGIARMPDLTDNNIITDVCDSNAVYITQNRPYLQLLDPGTNFVVDIVGEDPCDNLVTAKVFIAVEGLQPTLFGMIYGTNISFRSTGNTTNDRYKTDYTTDLIGLTQIWTMITGATNVFLNGTNYFNFPLPDTNAARLYFRIRRE